MPAKTVKMTAYQATKSRIGSLDLKRRVGKLDLKRRFLGTEKKRIITTASGSAVGGVILGILLQSFFEPIGHKPAGS